MNPFLCLNCSSTLKHQEETQITCPDCLAVYPVLEPGIPVLLRKPSMAIAHTIIQYDKLISDYRRNIQALQKSLASNTRSADTVNKLVGAYETNIWLFNTLKQRLEQHIGLDEFATYVTGGKVGRERYNISLNYLKRDWSGRKSGEEELSQLMVFLESMLPAGSVADGPILFLGAGLARIPVEFTRVYKEVYAVDNSLNMAALFGMVKQGDISFYDIQLKNNAATNQLAERITASASVSKESINPVNYLVANSLELPFPDHFFSAVVSIYFTDVMPFDAQLQEIKRVTGPGGLFVHYGPLDYHHSDVSCMYSFEELKERIISNGYAKNFEDKYTGAHCSSEANGLSKTYTNWMACFRKSEGH